MGSLHSIQLAKVAQSGVVFFVEGDDKPFLTDVAYKMGGRYFDALSKIAIQELKGKGNWQYAIGAAKALKAASGGAISTVLLLDRDFMLDDEEAQFLVRAKNEGLVLKVWLRKEIENYFINPHVIARFVSRSIEEKVDHAEIEEMLEDVERSVIEDATLSFADVIQKASQPRIEAKTAVKRARSLIDAKLAEGARLCHIASGKEVISGLSQRCQTKYGVSFNALALCKEMKAQEVDQEVRDVIQKLCNPSSLDADSFANVALSGDQHQ
jgi:hypothetical protein